jgi:DNA gyrase subunit A
MVSLSPDSPGLAVGTAQGSSSESRPTTPGNKDDWEIIALKEGDQLVGAAELRTGDEDLVFITSDAQLLHFPASPVRPQGRTAGGIAGIKLAPAPTRCSFAAVDPEATNIVVTSSGSSVPCRAPSPGRSRSPRMPSTRPRAAAPAGSAATASCAEKTP